MRRYFLALLILFLTATLSFAAGVDGVVNPAVVDGVATPDSVDGVSGLAAGGAEPTYLLHEDWESGSATFGGDADNMYVWIEDRAGSGANANYTSTILEGNESAELNDSRYYYTFAPTNDKIYVSYIVQLDPVSVYCLILRRADNKDIIGLSMEFDAGEGKFKGKIYYDGDGDGTIESNGDPSAFIWEENTTYYFKLEFDNGTGSDNGTASFSYSASPFAGWTNLPGMDIAAGPDEQATAIELQVANSNQAIFDDIRVDDEDITY